MKRFVLFCLGFAAVLPVSVRAQDGAVGRTASVGATQGAARHGVAGAGGEKTDAFLRDLLYAKASPFLRRVLDKPDSFRYQLIYTRIDRDRHNRPRFHNYNYRVNPLEYFNPASTVKMPLAFLALEKMDSLARYGVDRNTPMLTDSAYSGQAVIRPGYQFGGRTALAGSIHPEDLPYERQ